MVVVKPWPVKATARPTFPASGVARQKDHGVKLSSFSCLSILPRRLARLTKYRQVRRDSLDIHEKVAIPAMEGRCPIPPRRERLFSSS